jgi:hypothetical protein
MKIFLLSLMLKTKICFFKNHPALVVYKPVKGGSNYLLVNLYQIHTCVPQGEIWDWTYLKLLLFLILRLQKDGIKNS